ncbi:hypothetical protein BDV25DRAFT_137253 [Aspergillus avenaceus]|uniref:EF-hand domain-containing protein n=1 Tax=Aspergillus avenaceus TaxID=36643 RepID=A0A5N6U2Z4_ASPAV|nr:hypothetical protein BDV25DRAFT_137253 [Aspergillus avenaceus]
MAEEEQMKRQFIDKVFQAADANGDGSIDFDELRHIQESINDAFPGLNEPIEQRTDEEWREDFDFVDTDHNGRITKEEFVDNLLPAILGDDA